MASTLTKRKSHSSIHPTEKKSKNYFGINDEIVNKILEQKLTSPPQIWRGTNDKINLGLLYILSRHDNVCSYVPLTITFNVKTGKFEDKIIKLDNAIWSCSDEKKTSHHKLSINQKITDNILSCDKRFVVIPLTLIGKCQKKEIIHSNALIFDKINNTLERFEPHGLLEEGTFGFENELLDKELKKFFNENIIPGVTFLNSLDTCPMDGFQAIENDETSNFILQFNERGYCAAWSLFYMDIRLSNPDIPPIVLVKYLLETISKSPKNFKEFIQGYSQFILSFIPGEVTDAEEKTLKNIKLLQKLIDYRKAELIETGKSGINDEILETLKSELSSENTLLQLDYKKYLLKCQTNIDNKIKFITGSRWSFDALVQELKENPLPGEVVLFNSSILNESKSYEDAVKNILKYIKMAAKSKKNQIIFLALPGTNSKFDGKDLFVNFCNIGKYYLSAENDLIIYLLKKYFVLPELDYFSIVNAETKKLLNSINFTDQDELRSNIEKIYKLETKLSGNELIDKTEVLMTNDIIDAGFRNFADYKNYLLEQDKIFAKKFFPEFEIVNKNVTSVLLNYYDTYKSIINFFA